MNNETMRKEFEAFSGVKVEAIYLGGNAHAQWCAWQSAWKAAFSNDKLREGWQPIETAPLDGTHVHGLCEYNDKLFVIPMRFVSDDEINGWYQWGSDPTDYIDGQCFPTHWMPLPQPPAKEAA